MMTDRPTNGWANVVFYMVDRKEHEMGPRLEQKKGGKDRISSFFGTSLAIGIAYSTNAFQWPTP